MPATTSPPHDPTTSPFATSPPHHPTTPPPHRLLPRHLATSPAPHAPPHPGRLRIKVSDTGIGIAAEKLRRLYTPFERLGAERTDIEGTGIGLALTKYLVEAMQGTIGVSSTVDQGSTFWVDLPLAEGAEWQAEWQEASLDLELAPPPDLAHQAPAPGTPHAICTVLCIEDNPPDIQLIERALADRPEVRLLTARQDRVGLEWAREHQPDLILLGLHLSVSSDLAGAEVLAQLRADPAVGAIPIAVIGADATAGRMKELLAAGVHTYLTKPLDVKRLLRVVEETLAESQQSLLQ